MRNECWLERIDHCIPLYSHRSLVYEMFLKMKPDALKGRFILGDMIILCVSKDGNEASLTYVEYGYRESYLQFKKFLEEKGYDCRTQTLEDPTGNYKEREVTICLDKDRCTKFILTHLKRAR